MKYLFSPVTGGEFNPCAGALIRLSQERIETLLQRKAVFDAVKAKDPDCLEMYYWDATPHWVSDGTDLNDDETSAPDLIEQIEALTGQPMDWHKAALLPVGAELDVRVMRSECDQVLVREEGVIWLTIPKHMDSEVRTFEIPWAVIDKVTA